MSSDEGAFLTRVPLYCAVSTAYALCDAVQAVRQEAERRYPGVWAPLNGAGLVRVPWRREALSVAEWADAALGVGAGEAIQIAERYWAWLARRMFDYITLACAGESRFAVGLVWWGHAGHPHPPQTRHEAVGRAAMYDPGSLLRAAKRLFERPAAWQGAFGGAPWAKIAEVGLEYLQWGQKRPYVWMDRVVDLSHHGGLMFNKGCVFSLGHPHRGHGQASVAAYRQLLDSRRAGTASPAMHSRFHAALESRVPGFASKRCECEWALAPCVAWGQTVFEARLAAADQTARPVAVAGGVWWVG
ncbi:MAG: hypothetical protein QN130_12325 [Armatimonadota bacterium]|nr:hypothetical protein [Armatimonadota bacterium]